MVAVDLEVVVVAVEVVGVVREDVGVEEEGSVEAPVSSDTVNPVGVSLVETCSSVAALPSREVVLVGLVVVVVAVDLELVPEAEDDDELDC